MQIDIYEMQYLCEISRMTQLIGMDFEGIEELLDYCQYVSNWIHESDYDQSYLDVLQEIVNRTEGYTTFEILYENFLKQQELKKIASDIYERLMGQFWDYLNDERTDVLKESYNGKELNSKEEDFITSEIGKLLKTNNS